MQLGQIPPTEWLIMQQCNFLLLCPSGGFLNSNLQNLKDQQEFNNGYNISTSINNQQQKEEPPRYAILVNDMLNDFIQGSLRSDRANFIIPQIRLLLDTAKQKNIPVFYCNDEHLQTDSELKLWGQHAMKGTEGAK